jgi:hypothetical protein
MTTKHVFLSYLREDKERVDELQAALQEAGYAVWRDTKDLWPGENWETKIRDAIIDGSMVFLAVFSSSLELRERSYQYAELTIAAEQYKLRPPDTSWLMTVRLDDCSIPSTDLGGGRYLDRTIHRVDLFGSTRFANLIRLVAAINRVFESTPGPTLASSREAISELREENKSELLEVRSLLRDPSNVMDYDAFIKSLTRKLTAGLDNRDLYPMTVTSDSSVPDLIRAWVHSMQSYESLTLPVLESIKLLCMYGTPAHALGVANLMRGVAQRGIINEGVNILRYAHQYPALILSYTIGLAALCKNNFALLSTALVAVDVTVLHEHKLPFIAYCGPGTVGDNNRISTLLVRANEGVNLTDEYIEEARSGQVGALHTPISDELYNFLAPIFAEEFPTDSEYEEAFSYIEVLFDAIGADARLTIERFYGGNNGYGRYTWLYRRGANPPEVSMLAEAKKQGAKWPPVAAGIFGGHAQRAIAALEEVNRIAAEASSRRW